MYPIVTLRVHETGEKDIFKENETGGKETYEKGIVISFACRYAGCISGGLSSCINGHCFKNEGDERKRDA